MTAPTTTAWPCAVCGQLCGQPGELVTKTLSRQSPSGQRIGDAVVTMTRCSMCTGRHAAAADLVTAHPAMAAQLGSSRAREVAEGLLTALAVLELPELPSSVTSGELSLWIRHLGTLGLSLSFQTRLDGPGTPSAPYPWAFLDESDRQRLRDGYANLLAEKVARNAAPVALAPPSGQPSMPGVVLGGCLFCGVGSISMPAAEVTRRGGQQAAEREVWQAISGVDPSSIGGRISPDRLSGYLCRSCGDALDSVGAVGPTVLYRSLLAHLDRSGRADDAARLRIAGVDAPLVAWCVLTGAPAVSTPWAFLTLV